MSGFNKFTQPIIDDKTVRTKTVYKKLSDKKYGMNIAIIGAATEGKSTIMYSFGYFNSKYVSRLDKNIFPYTIRLLKEGHMPEVEKIVVHDMDGSFEKSASRGKFEALLKPLRPIIEIVEFDMPNRDVEVVDGKLKNVRVEELFKCKRQIEDAAREAITDFGPEVLWGNDTISEYYERLDAMFSIVYEAAFDKTFGSKVEHQKDWQIRNAWWNEYMKRKRKYKGWQIDNVKAVEKVGHFYNLELKKNPKADPYNIKWAEGSGGNKFNLDQVYRLFKTADGIPYFNLVAGRYKSQIAIENMKIYYPYNKKDIAFYFIEHMAKYIIEGSDLKEEEMWSVSKPPKVGGKLV